MKELINNKIQSNYVRIKANGWVLYVHREYRNLDLEEVLTTNQELLEKTYAVQEIPSSKFTDVYKLKVAFDGKEHNLYLKRYLHRSKWDFVKHILRKSRAMREFQASVMLKSSGFCAPNIIVMGEKRVGMLCVENFILTGEIENAKAIYMFFPDQKKDLPLQQFDNKRNFIESFGREIGRLHAKGIFHGDLRTGNVLVQDNGDGWNFFLLDNERTKKFRKLPGQLRVKNLVQINIWLPSAVSRTDRLRFFNSYLQENRDIRRTYKKLAGRILQKTNLRERKKQVY